MEEKNMLYDAIDSHSQFSPNQKDVLKALLKLEVGGETAATINDLLSISKCTRATISTAIAYLNKYGVISNTNVKGKKFTGCRINKDKLDVIIDHYKKKKNLIIK